MVQDLKSNLTGTAAEEHAVKANYDIVIVGGGMVGSMLAAALAHTSLQIAVLETSSPSEFDPSQDHDLRVSAISLASEKMLEAVGAWDHIKKMRICPFRHMEVWDGEVGGGTTFYSGDIGETHLGHIVENRVLQLALLKVLQQHSTIDLFCPQGLRDFRVLQDSVEVVTTEGQQINAKLIIGADGANSQVRKIAGISTVQSSYPQHALVATVETSRPQQSTTWQKFLPTGPQAFLPLSGNFGSVVWYHSLDEINRLKELTDSSFIEELEHSFPDQLGGIVSVKGRASFPLQRAHAGSYVMNRLALIGDAAHTVHPLAGQGVNLGLLDAAALAEIIVQTHNQERDIGAYRHLRGYERWRKTENELMIRVLDGFYHAFKPQARPVQSVRSAVLNVVNQLSPVKALATRYAVGKLGEIPALAEGRLP